jgi:hypothetical protein
MQVGLDEEINNKVRELELLRTKISSLSDPTLVESTIAKLDAEYKQLLVLQQQVEKDNIAQKKAVADEIQMALTLIQEYEVEKKEQMNEMNVYIQQRKEECDKIKLLDS